MPVIRSPDILIGTLEQGELQQDLQSRIGLRYRLQGGAISWFFKMHRPDIYVDGVVAGTFERFRQATGLPLYEGAPEA